MVKSFVSISATTQYTSLPLSYNIKLKLSHQFNLYVKFNLYCQLVISYCSKLSCCYGSAQYKQPRHNVV